MFCWAHTEKKSYQNDQTVLEAKSSRRFNFLSEIQLLDISPLTVLISIKTDKSVCKQPASSVCIVWVGSCNSIIVKSSHMSVGQRVTTEVGAE